MKIPATKLSFSVFADTDDIHKKKNSASNPLKKDPLKNLTWTLKSNLFNDIYQVDFSFFDYFG